MTSSLKKIGLPNLDALCNADFVKKTIKFKTKKELITFLQDEENEGDLTFLKGLDQKVLSQHAHFRQEIQEYFLTIADKVKLFREEVKKQEKLRLKEAKALKAQENKELEKLKEQEIIERYLKKKALEEEQKAILERNGLAPKPKIQLNPKPEPESTPKPLGVTPQRQTISQEVQTVEEIVVNQIVPKAKTKPKLNLKTKAKPEPKEMELDLEDYFRIARQLVKEDVFQVYTDTGEAIEVQCLMMEGDKIKMILKTD